MLTLKDLPVGSRVFWPSYSPTMRGTVYRNEGDYILVDWDGWCAKCSVQYSQDTITQFLKISAPKPLIIIGV